MYLDENRVKKALSKAKLQMIVGVIFIVFFGFGIVGGIVNYGDLRPNIPVYVTFILPFIWMVWLSMRNRRMVEKSRQLNQMFCSDADGDIQASQLIHLLGSKNDYAAAEEVNRLIGKGFLRNCTVEQHPQAHVVLYRSATNTVSSYVVGDATGGAAGCIVSVKCPNCGAKVEKRVGFTASCPYCDTKFS